MKQTKRLKLSHIENIIRSLQPDLWRTYKIKEIGVFGSYVRNEQKEKSDLDVLVDFAEPISLLQFVRLKMHLSKALGFKVDLVMKSALKPYIGRHILQEVKFIHA